MMYGGYGDWGLAGWIMMAVMMLLFWGGLAALAVLLIRGTRGGVGGYNPGLWNDDPEHILAQRFARGQIVVTDFKARRAALRRRQ